MWKRFWEKISISDKGCWEWNYAKDKDGYGLFNNRGKMWRVHRLTYTMMYGSIGNLVIDHLCRNIKCCNPLHLEAVTPKINSERGIISSKIQCIRNHEFNKKNTLIRKNGTRNCRKYSNIRSIIYYRRKIEILE